MKKQINPTIKAHLLRSALILLALLAVCAIPFSLGQRSKQSTQSHQAPGAGPPVVQEKFKSPAADTGNEKYKVRMMAPPLPGPVSFQRFETPTPVPSCLLPNVKSPIDNTPGA